MNYDYATLTDSREDYNHNELFNTDVTPRRARGITGSERCDSTTDGARTFFRLAARTRTVGFRIVDGVVGNAHRR